MNAMHVKKKKVFKSSSAGIVLILQYEINQFYYAKKKFNIKMFRNNGK